MLSIRKLLFPNCPGNQRSFSRWTDIMNAKNLHPLMHPQSNRGQSTKETFLRIVLVKNFTYKAFP